MEVTLTGVMARVKEMLNDNGDLLMTANAPDVYRIQGIAQALRRVLELPEEIRNEQEE